MNVYSPEKASSINAQQAIAAQMAMGQMASPTDIANRGAVQGRLGRPDMMSFLNMPNLSFMRNDTRFGTENQIRAGTRTGPQGSATYGPSANYSSGGFDIGGASVGGGSEASDPGEGDVGGMSGDDW
jgi:hypothetical protein